MTLEMAIVEELTKRSSLDFESASARAEFVQSIATSLAQRCGPAICPNPGDALAYTIWYPKTAALAFDRVYRIPIMDQPIPKEIGYFGATKPEIIWCAIGLFQIAAEHSGIRIAGIHDVAHTESPATRERSSIMHQLSDLASLYGRMPTIYFRHDDDRTDTIGAGAHETLHSVIRDVALVDEDSLSWEQVLEFRSDADARRLYKRAIRWIATELKASTPEQIQDSLSERLDAYESALRKHGIATVLGTLSSLTDPGFIGGVSAAVAATSLSTSSLWGGLIGISLTVGKAALSVGIARVEAHASLKTASSEIAYVHQIKKMSA